jgi:methylphosphotriester-DNA--protein-cysteine methyltransferase
MKLCKKCNIEKDESEFGKRKHTSDKLETCCRKCYNEVTNNWKKVNLEKIRPSRFNTALKRKYGISAKNYEEMRQSQNNSCAICKEPHTDLTKSMAVDHCHSTGKIRGLLCTRCNLMLGQARDNKEILSKAIEYLEKDNG